MASYKFVDGLDEIANAVVEFNKEPNYYRELVGNNPLYFINLKNDNRQLFGLSKFCAFKNISIEAYLREYRYTTDGGKTQNHLKTTTASSWMKYDDLKYEIKIEFSKWIHSFFPNYNINRACFITIPEEYLAKQASQCITTPTELEEILELKKLIGETGEGIAYEYECNRLAELGAENPKLFITHTALQNVNAGFDIFSDYNKDARFIEVKSSIRGKGDVYLSSNELRVFMNNPKKAYLYLINITDLSSKIGFVERIIDDLNDLGELEPILFKVVKT